MQQEGGTDSPPGPGSTPPPPTPLATEPVPAPAPPPPLPAADPVEPGAVVAKGKGKEPLGSQKRRRDVEDGGAFLSGGSMQRVFDLVMKNVDGSGAGAGSGRAAGSAGPSSASAALALAGAAAGAGASSGDRKDGDESSKRAKVQILMQALKRTDANNAMDNLSNGLASFGGAGASGGGLGAAGLTEDDQDADLQAALAASAAMDQ